MKAAPLALAALAAMTACAPTPVDKNTRAPSGLAEIACLGAVSTQSGAAEVGVVDSQFSQAGTFVKLYVGDTDSNWSCVATEDGVVQSVTAG